MRPLLAARASCSPCIRWMMERRICSTARARSPISSSRSLRISSSRLPWATHWTSLDRRMIERVMFRLCRIFTSSRARQASASDRMTIRS